MDQVSHAYSTARTEIYKAQVTYRTYVERSIPFVKERWAAEGVLYLVFLGRVVISQGWYVECYALSIFLLNLFLGFLSPKFTPELRDDLASEDVEAGLPTHNDRNGDEFKPFIRRVPEFHFWLLSLYGTLAALLTTVSRTTDIPVYWPILLVYFFVLLFLTMRRQIEHMIKYKYVPFDFGKKKFTK